MCEWVSGEAVKVDDDEVLILLGDMTDSHTDIRGQHKIGEDDGKALHRYHTPFEFVPTKIDAFDDYQFKFDTKKPDWWTDHHTSSAIRQLRAEAVRRYELLLGGGKWQGYIYLRNLTATGKLTQIVAGGSIYYAG